MAGMKRFGSGCLRIALMTGVIVIVIAFAFLGGLGAGAFTFFTGSFQDRRGRVPPTPIPSTAILAAIVLAVACLIVGLILGRMFFAKSPRQMTSAASAGGLVPMMNNKLPDTDDVEKLRAERQKYYDEAQANYIDYVKMKADRDNIRQQLEDERDKKIREKYENLKQDYRQLEGDLRRAQDGYQTAQRSINQLQQQVDQLRRDIANLGNDKKNLAWQLQAAKEREQALMTLDQSREREIKRWKELADRLRQGGAGAPVANQEFADPEPGDPPDYEREKEKHNHRKVIPENGGAFQLADGWRLIGASRRGRGHELNHKYRDDDFAVMPFGNGQAVVVAIADGLGSKPFSRWGARAAVDGAVRAVDERSVLQLASMVAKLGEQQRPSAVQASPAAQRQFDDDMFNRQKARDEFAKQLIEKMLYGAREMVGRKAQKEGKSVDELHSTLQVFLAIPHTIARNERFMYFASAQVGDGAIRSVSRATSSGQWTMPEQPQLNGIDNEVQPFMRFDPSRYRDLIHVTDLESPEFIVGMTDGTLDDIEGGPDENGLFKGIEDFYGRIRQEALATPKPADGLFNFLGYRKRASFDDRTLVCLYRGS